MLQQQPRHSGFEHLPLFVCPTFMAKVVSTLGGLGCRALAAVLAQDALRYEGLLEQAHRA
jgi:hypothetical protein